MKENRFLIPCHFSHTLEIQQGTKMRNFPSVSLADHPDFEQLLPQTEPCKAQWFTRPPGTFAKNSPSSLEIDI